MDEAISTSGGVCWSELNQQPMVKQHPVCFWRGNAGLGCPTGGYLLTACLANGVAAAQASTAG